MIASKSRDPGGFVEARSTGAPPLCGLATGGCLIPSSMPSLEGWEPPFNFMLSTGEFEATVGEVRVDEAVVLLQWAVTESPSGKNIDWPGGIVIERFRGIAPSPSVVILFTAVGAARIKKISSKGKQLTEPTLIRS